METKKLRAGIKIIVAIRDTIKDAGAVPAGHLYAILSQFGCTKENFDKIIDLLKQQGNVTEMNNLLYWIEKK